ncbi:hypothetical protein ACYU03_25440 [Pseudomonas sp. X10]
MRHALTLSLVALLLAGCASHKPEDYNGIWINQNAIDAATKGTSLRQALASNGPNFEWKVDVARQQASYANGFEVAEGQLDADEKQWRVTFFSDQSEHLALDGNQLIQAGNQGAPQQSFKKALSPASSTAPTGSSFEKALYGAYLGGNWKIIEGPGKGGIVHFHDNGSVDGLPELDRYALCLAGDCATISGEYDSLWLERNQRGNPWIFKRDGDSLEILRARNSAQPDEMPQLAPGPRQWLLERD